jgi:hypothetical protein
MYEVCVILLPSTKKIFKDIKIFFLKKRPVSGASAGIF